MSRYLQCTFFKDKSLQIILETAINFAKLKEKRMKLWFFVAFLSIFINQNTFAADTTHVKETVYRFKKGGQFAKPMNVFGRFVKVKKSIRWQCRFDKSCEYLIKNKDGSLHEDQYDWLKLCGITFTPLHTRRNTAMVGWRYNHLKKVFELTPYWHVNGKRLFEDARHIDVKTDENFETEMILDKANKKITVVIKTKNGRLEESKNFDFFRTKWATVIHPFFGGTSVAPNDMWLICTRL